MHSRVALLFVVALLGHLAFAGDDDYQPGPDSVSQAGVPKGELIKGSYVAKEGSVFPGTERDYTIYLPPRSGDAPVPAEGGEKGDLGKGRDRSVPTPWAGPYPFMVFQDGVIYNAPTVFDNLIAKKQIPPLIGIFIKPGVVPAANPNALPRYNRSYEYDSVTDTYSRFLLDEFLPAIEAKHGIKLSTDPNDAAIAGNSSGGICAFMAAWHRPDRIRRVFSGVGTYVGIHGADQLPVLVRKYEPKPLRVYLQSGEHDNDLYCGDWWMANQMMERSLKWAGYDVNHTWGTGGHNSKHATSIFPDVLRWLWRDYATAKEIKANPRGESKWRGYEVVGDGGWEVTAKDMEQAAALSADRNGDIIAIDRSKGDFWRLSSDKDAKRFGKGHAGGDHGIPISRIVFNREGKLIGSGNWNHDGMSIVSENGSLTPFDASSGLEGWSFCLSYDGWFYLARPFGQEIVVFPEIKEGDQAHDPVRIEVVERPWSIALTPDQTQLYVIFEDKRAIQPFQITKEHKLIAGQPFAYLEMNDEGKADARGLCVDTNGWLYVATALGIQVCDQAGRVNFIIPTPQQPHDVCFGGKDLSELFIACGDKIYKRPTKAHGYISGQMAPIKPAPPKL